MAQTQLSSRLGGDKSIYGLQEQAHPKRSVFDFSRKHFTTIDIGPITPVDIFDTFPGDNVELSCRYLLDTMPLEVPSMTNYFVRTHWFFVKKSALWKGWNTFITKGRTGNIDLEIPSIPRSDIIAASSRATYYFNGSSVTAPHEDTPNSLMAYLGLPPVHLHPSNDPDAYLPWAKDANIRTTGYEIPSKVNALPFMAVQKIYRHDYAPANLMQDNKVWFPDDYEDEWRINYAASNIKGALFLPDSAFNGTWAASGYKVSLDIPATNDSVVDLLSMRYAQFGRDYFTDMKPWLVRGVEETIDFPLQGKFAAQFTDDSDLVTKVKTDNNGFGTDSSKILGGAQGDGNVNIAGTSFGVQSSEKVLAVDLSASSLRYSLSANTWRNLMALSVWQERNSLSSGNYNTMIGLHWNHKPRSPEWEPIYIGGTTDLVNFGEVLQTSSSVAGSPLGRKAGTGSASGGAKVFNFTADDYGYIIGMMFIQPETTYVGGVERMWTDLDFDSQYFPEFANLGYQPVLNQEICASNTSSDDDLAGYQTRYAYLKVRLNRASGKFALKAANDNIFGNYLQARRYASNEVPSLSAQFVTMIPQNVDRNFLSFKSEPAFKLQFASDVRLVRSLPYQSTPATAGF